MRSSAASASSNGLRCVDWSAANGSEGGGGTEDIVPTSYHTVLSPTHLSAALSRYGSRVLLEPCRRTLSARRLDALPPALRARTEMVALRYAVALSEGQ